MTQTKTSFYIVAEESMDFPFQLLFYKTYMMDAWQV